jgi:hypothetical protein
VFDAAAFLEWGCGQIIPLLSSRYSTKYWHYGLGYDLHINTYHPQISLLPILSISHNHGKLNSFLHGSISVRSLHIRLPQQSSVRSRPRDQTLSAFFGCICICMFATIDFLQSFLCIFLPEQKSIFFAPLLVPSQPAFAVFACSSFSLTFSHSLTPNHYIFGVFLRMEYISSQS